MIDTKLRQSVQPSFDLMGKGLIRLHMTPNQITVLAFIIGLITAFVLGFGYPMVALLLLWLSGLFDVLDGTVARLTNTSSKTGAYLDLVFDRVVEGAIILGFFAFMPDDIWAYLIFLVGAMFNFTTFLVAATLFKNDGQKSVHYDVGLVERTETFIVFSLMMLLPAYAFVLLMVFNAIMILTGIIRFKRILQAK